LVLFGFWLAWYCFWYICFGFLFFFVNVYMKKEKEKNIYE